MATDDVELANRALSVLGLDLVVSAISENTNLNIFYSSDRDFVLAMHPWNFAIKRDRLTAAGILDCSSKVITFADADPDTIADDGSGLVTAGFETGDIASIVGSASNNTAYDVNSVVAGKLTLETAEEVTAEILTNDTDLKLFALNTAGKFKFAKPSDCLRVLKINEINVFNEPYTWVREGKFIIFGSKDTNDQIPIKYIKQVTDTTLYDTLFEECFVIKLLASLSMGDKENPDATKMWLKHLDYRFKQGTQRNAFESNRNTRRPDTSWQSAGR